MTLEPSIEEIMFKTMKGRDIYKASHKSVTMSICVSKSWVSIWSIHSKNEGKGEANEAIIELKKRYPDKKFYASIPLHPAAEHLFKKHDIFYDKPMDNEKYLENADMLRMKKNRQN